MNVGVDSNKEQWTRGDSLSKYGVLDDLLLSLKSEFKLSGEVI